MAVVAVAVAVALLVMLGVRVMLVIPEMRGLRLTQLRLTALALLPAHHTQFLLQAPEELSLFLGTHSNEQEQC
jgi:hypothetical protein